MKRRSPEQAWGRTADRAQMIACIPRVRIGPVIRHEPVVAGKGKARVDFTMRANPPSACHRLPWGSTKADHLGLVVLRTYHYPPAFRAERLRTIFDIISSELR